MKLHICKYCGKEFEQGVQLGGHTRLCKKNPKYNENHYKCCVEHNGQRGTKHSDEQKKLISESRKKYLKEHPEKVPYVLNHHSKGDSYPERYFKHIFQLNNYEYKQNYYQSGYFLDFAWPDRKIYIEVDGEQHYLDNRIIEHDKIRTEKLLNEGWVCINRIRWSKYQKMTKDEKIKYIKQLFEILNKKQ